MLDKFHIILCLLLLSCAHQQEVLDSVALPIEGQWPCFNGREIVLQGGRYGLVKENGEPVLPSEYDAIEFLDNEIALLTQGETGFLSDKDGRILAEDDSVDRLRNTWVTRVEEAREADRQSWEHVVQSYETLCKACKAQRGKHLNRSDFSRLQSLKETVIQTLQKATGHPTPSQKARLESLSADYRRAF